MSHGYHYDVYDDEGEDTEYNLLPSFSPLMVIEKLEVMFFVESTNFRAHADTLFMELSLGSGLIDDEARRKINLMSSHPLISEELKELFRPSSSDVMTYQEYYRGINQMLTSYAMRNPVIQDLANCFVIKQICHAEMTLGRVAEIEPFIQTLEAKQPAASKKLFDLMDKERESLSRESGKGLFRSASTGDEEFSVAYKEFFVKSEETLRLLNSCFPDFFVRDSGQASLKREDASPAMLLRYKRLWDLFADGDGVVRRPSFILGMSIAAENFIGTNQHIMNTVYSYLLKKLMTARAVLNKIRDSDTSFEVGTRVMFESGTYRERIPAVIESVSDCTCGRLNCGKNYIVRLCGDPTGELYKAKIHHIRLAGPTDIFDESVSRELLMKTVLMDKSDAAYERDSYDILHSLKEKFPENFSFTEADLTPANQVKSVPFEYSVIVGGSKHIYHFDKFDYGITFEKFLYADCMDAKYFDPSRLDKSACAKESMRCFFLHVGLAVGIHPFALMVAFRKLATQLQAKPPAPDDDEEAKGNFQAFNSDPLNSVLARGDFVDSMVLNAIWPTEFDEYQVLIVNLDRHGGFNESQGFTHIRPPNSTCLDANGEWTGKDIMLTLHDGHFTLLRPNQSRNDSRMRLHPITTMLEHARRCNYLIAQPNFTMFPDLFPTQFLPAYRVSLFETLKKTLESPQPPDPPPFMSSSGSKPPPAVDGSSSLPLPAPAPASSIGAPMPQSSTSSSSPVISKSIDSTAALEEPKSTSGAGGGRGDGSGIEADAYTGASSIYTIDRTRPVTAGVVEIAPTNNNIYFTRNLYDIPVTISNDIDVSQISNPKPT